MTTHRNFSNTAVQTTLNGAINDSQTDLDVDSDTGWPAVPFTMRIDSEVILVTARTGTDFSTISRGYDGTTAAAHSDGATCDHVVAGIDVGQAKALVDNEGDDRVVVEDNGDITVYKDDGATVAALWNEASNQFELTTVLDIDIPTAEGVEKVFLHMEDNGEEYDILRSAANHLWITQGSGHVGRVGIYDAAGGTLRDELGNDSIRWGGSGSGYRLRVFETDGSTVMMELDDNGDDADIVFRGAHTSPHVVIEGSAYPGFIIADDSNNRMFCIEQNNGEQHILFITYNSSGASAESVLELFHSSHTQYNDNVVRVDGRLLLAENGSESAPTVARSDDLDTGFYFSTDKINATQGGNGGEFFPQTYLDSGLVESGTDLNPTSTYAEIAGTVQTIAVEYASQPVLVQLVVRGEWKNITGGEVLRLGPSINGSQAGIGSATSDSLGVAAAGGDNVDVDGSSSSESSHQHGLGIYHSQSHSGNTQAGSSHSHGSGSYTVNGTHTHNYDPTLWTQERSIHYETTADGSGNVKVAMAASTSTGNADIDYWSISWTIWRR